MAADNTPEIGADANSYSITTGAGSVYALPRLGGISRYFPNLEAYPGQLYVKPPLTSARREGKIGRAAAVVMARALERSNEHIRGGADKRTNMVVGATLRVMPQPNWKLLAAVSPQAAAAITPEWSRQFGRSCYGQFNDWGYDQRLLCDAEGHYNFGGLMWQAERLLEGPDAESLGVIHYDQDRADAYAHRWATFVTVVDSDRLSTPYDLVGDPLVQEGRELDVNGRWTGLWITQGHPADGGLDATTWVRAPRENSMGRPMAWHYFRKKRAGEQRGLTTWITILRSSGMFEQFDDAQLGNAIKAANVATYIETGKSADVMANQLAPSGENGGAMTFGDKIDYYGRTKLRLGGQRLVLMPPEDKITMQGMENSIPDPSGFRNGFLRAFASSLGISFEQLSNNYSEANYSSARAALLEVWRGIMVDRVLFTSHVASLIYSAVIEEAIAKGRIVLPPGAPDFYEYRAAYVNCSWTGPGMGWIDPQKEATAQATRLANKTTTRESEIAQQGGNYEEVFEQIHEEDLLAAELDITLTAPATPQVAGNPALPGADAPDDEPAEPTPAKQKIARGKPSGDA